jgi:hypothetical protein
MNKKVKIAIAVVAVIVVVVVVYYVFKAPGVTWEEHKGGDIGGFDIEIDQSGLTVAAAKAKAEQLKAKSFLMNGSTTFFKSVSGPIKSDPAGSYILYVAK